MTPGLNQTRPSTQAANGMPEWPAMMTSVSARHLLGEDVALGLEDPAIDDLGAAMDDAERSATVVELQRLRERAHPRAHFAAHARVGERIPALGQHRAFGAFLEIAGAILGGDGKLLFAVALDHVASPIGDEARGFLWRCAVGHDIARADDVARRNSQRVRAPPQGFGGLEVRVRAAEHQERLGQ